MNIQRYYIDRDGEYEPDPTGEWVRWTDVEAALAKFAGPRCELCGNLCIDAAKDEEGFCPDCSSLASDIEKAGYHP